MYGSLSLSSESQKPKLQKKQKNEPAKTAKNEENEENKLGEFIIDEDKTTIESGEAINEALNQGIGCFIPDLFFEQLVKNFSIAKQIYGASLIRYLTAYDEDYIDKNIRIPEFQKELKKNIESSIERLKDNGFIEKDGTISDRGIELASLILYADELNNLIPKGIFGEKIHKKNFIYGDKENIKIYKKGDRYRDIAIKKSIKLAVRRGHFKLSKDDLKSFERQSKGQIYLIYCLDASSSMKGKKIEMCKKAGIALAYKAIEEKDKVGLIVFGSDIKVEVKPTLDFRLLLDKITRIKASKETDIGKTIRKSIELFPAKDGKQITKHLILITDAVPTVGEKPESETLEAVSLARSKDITISLIGIKLDQEGKKLAEKITNLGDGRLYVIEDLAQLDRIVLMDYYGVM